MANLEELCKDYLNDRLEAGDRKWLEERIANGDEAVIATLKRLQSFKTGFSASDTPPTQPDSDEEDHLQNFLKDAPRPQPQTTHSISDTALKNDGVRNRFLRVATLIGVIFLFFLAMQQWRLHQVQQQAELLSGQIDQSDEQLLELDEQLNAATFQNQHLQSLLFRDNVFVQRLDMGDGRSGMLLFLWETSSWDHALLTKEVYMGTDERLLVWQNSADEGDWEKLASINEVNNDSLYTGWDTSQLNTSSELEFRLHTTEVEDDRNEGEYLGTISLR